MTSNRDKLTDKPTQTRITAAGIPPMPDTWEGAGKDQDALRHMAEGTTMDKRVSQARKDVARKKSR